MKKPVDDEEAKMKANPPENKANFLIDNSKYQSFVDEIVIFK